MHRRKRRCLVRSSSGRLCQTLEHPTTDKGNVGGTDPEISLGNQMATSGPRRLGKYEVLEVIGRGGMGVVYKAVDPEIGRLVCIKMMTSGVINNPDHLKRFYREAQSAGKLQHPNIVTIYDLGVQEATPYLVMEFLEGESLDLVIRSRRKLSIAEKLNMVIRICDALAYAHERSIVHRDIKPANVMLLKDGTVKIVDFGIARIGGEKTVTRTGQMMGSIQFMSPEQINGAHVDLRTDIFSTGVLLYQLLTHVLPFEGKDTGDTLLKILHGSCPPLGQFLQGYPPELDGIVQRALARDPDQRYQTATELAFDLSHVQEQLKCERISEHLQAVELCMADAQWSRAKEELLQLLKIDRQNARANALLREVQQQLQKQHRFELVRDLQSHAEQALARNALDEALHCLDIAAGLDETNLQVCELRDSVREKKQRGDKLNQLLRRAESAHDAGDLDDALAAAQEALAVDGDSTDARALHAVMAREVAERAKLKQIQTFVEEARKQISSRRFTAALEVLKKAATLDPGASGINELITLASTGQQQERQRKELEQLSGEIEEALNRSDYAVACAKATEGLQRFPNERGLLKLKALVDKERDAHEKREYIESRVSLARRLLEEKKPGEARIPLQEALGKYPEEFVLQSMYSLVTENIERERAELFKAKIIQQAKEALRRKAYSEAIEILQTALRQTSSSEFDDLLQFAQDEAANYAKHQKINAAAKKAHSLMSANEYGQAIELLEAILHEVDDEELRIMLLDARRHVEEFKNGFQEVIATGHRLLHLQRYNEAVRFLESHSDVYGKLPEFSRVLEQIRHERHRVQAFSVVKEQARDALDKSDFEGSRAVLDKYREEFGDGQDAQLLEREIEAKREKAARTAVEQALNDCRVLLLVRSYHSVLDILDKVSGVVALVPPEIRLRYELARQTASTAFERSRLVNQRHESMKQRLPEAAERPALSDSERATAPSVGPIKNAGPETQVAGVTRLEEILGEVTLIAEHYQEDQEIQVEVGSLRAQLTLQIAALRQADAVQELGQEKADAVEKGVPGQQRRIIEAPAPEFGAAGDTGTLWAEPPASAEPATERQNEKERGEHQEEDPQQQEEAPLELTSPKPEPYQAAPPESQRPGAIKAVEPWDESAGALPTTPTVPGTATVTPSTLGATVEWPVWVPTWKRPVTLAALTLGLAALVWMGVHLLAPGQPKMTSVPTVKEPKPIKPQMDLLELRQRDAIDAADQLFAADDLEGALRTLQQAANLKGPLTPEILKKEAGIEAAMKDQGLRKLRRREEQMWQQALRQMNSGRFEEAKNDLRQILAMKDGGERKADARRYVEKVIPKRQEEERLFAQAQQALPRSDLNSLQRAADFLGQVIDLDGPRRPEAERLRSTVKKQLTDLAKQQRDQRIASLQSDALQNIRQGNFSSARQNVDQIRKLGGDPTSLSAELDQTEKARRAKADADTVFEQTVQRYQQALNSEDKNGIEAARNDFRMIALGGGLHAGEAQKYLSEISTRLAAVNQPPPAPVTPSVKPAAPSGNAAELKAVLVPVQYYAQAFEQKNPDALHQVWPTMGNRYAGYKKSFENASSIRMQVLTESVKIGADGTTATITALIAQDYTPKGQKTLSNKTQTVFQLAKSNGTWAITDVANRPSSRDLR